MILKNPTTVDAGNQFFGKERTSAPHSKSLRMIESAKRGQSCECFMRKHFEPNRNCSLLLKKTQPSPLKDVAATRIFADRGGGDANRFNLAMAIVPPSRLRHEFCSMAINQRHSGTSIDTKLAAANTLLTCFCEREEPEHIYLLSRGITVTDNSPTASHC